MYTYIYMNICTHIYIYRYIPSINLTFSHPKMEGWKTASLLGPAMFSDASQSNSRASSSPCVSMKIVEKFVSFLQAPPGYLSGYDLLKTNMTMEKKNNPLIYISCKTKCDFPMSHASFSGELSPTSTTRTIRIYTSYF